MELRTVDGCSVLLGQWLTILRDVCGSVSKGRQRCSRSKRSEVLREAGVGRRQAVDLHNSTISAASIEHDAVKYLVARASRSIVAAPPDH